MSRQYLPVLVPLYRSTFTGEENGHSEGIANITVSLQHNINDHEAYVADVTQIPGGVHFNLCFSPLAPPATPVPVVQVPQRVRIDQLIGQIQERHHRLVLECQQQIQGFQHQVSMLRDRVLSHSLRANGLNGVANAETTPEIGGGAQEGEGPTTPLQVNGEAERVLESPPNDGSVENAIEEPTVQPVMQNNAAPTRSFRRHGQ